MGRIGTGGRASRGRPVGHIGAVPAGQGQHEPLVIRVPDPFSDRRNSVAVMRKCATIRSRRSDNAAQAGSHHGHCQRNRFIPTPRRWSGCCFRSSREGGSLAGDLVATHSTARLNTLGATVFVEVCVCMSSLSPLRSPFHFAWQAAERARRARRETLVPSGRRVKKVIQVRLDLLVRPDRPDLRDRKALGRRLALRGHL
jgi:hypothetical protein